MRRVEEIYTQSVKREKRFKVINAKSQVNKCRVQIMFRLLNIILTLLTVLTVFITLFLHKKWMTLKSVSSP